MRVKLFDYDLINASGYLYRNGYLKKHEFIEQYNFNPGNYSKFFTVNCNDFVIAKKAFEEFCLVYFNKIHSNFNSIGVLTE